MISKLERVPLREVWKHEALDFTRWLEENIDVRAESLGITLLNVERERSAGRFSVDLGGYRGQERWPEFQAPMIDAMVRLERALRPHLAEAVEALKTCVTIKSSAN